MLALVLLEVRAIQVLLYIPVLEVNRMELILPDILEIHLCQI